MFTILAWFTFYLFYTFAGMEGLPCNVKSRGRAPCPYLRSDNHVLLAYVTEENNRLSEVTRETFIKDADDEFLELSSNICDKWNASIELSVDKDKKLININFKVFDIYESCFYSYDISLFFLWSNNCDPFKGDQISSSRLSASKKESVRESFEEYGYYCVIVTPISDKPEENIARNSPVIAILDKVFVKPKFSQNEPAQDYKKLVISASTVFCFAFLFALGVLWWKFNSNVKITHETKSLQELPVAVEKFEVYIIYSHSRQNKAKVTNLKAFLQDCAKYNVSLDEDNLDEILINPNDWLTERLNYKCSMTKACSSSKKFIIVESDNDRCFDNKNGECDEDEIEESLYRNAVNALSVDWVKCLEGYCHLFVVNFGDAQYPPEKLRYIAHNVRYTLPDHLVDLCLALEQSESDARRNELKQYLEVHPI